MTDEEEMARELAHKSEQAAQWALACTRITQMLNEARRWRDQRHHEAWCLAWGSVGWAHAALTSRHP